MPSSPIAKKVTLPDNWVQLQKTMIPDQATGCYWSVWFFEQPIVKGIKMNKDGTIPDNTGMAWLMWCPFGDDPSVNDSWGHVEDLDESCRNVLTAIEAVYGVSFFESIWIPMTAEQVVKDNPLV